MTKTKKTTKSNGGATKRRRKVKKSKKARRDRATTSAGTASASEQQQRNSSNGPVEPKQLLWDKYERSPNDRASCRSCGKKICQGVLRYGLVCSGQDRFGGADYFEYHHASCFQSPKHRPLRFQHGGGSAAAELAHALRQVQHEEFLLRHDAARVALRQQLATLRACFAQRLQVTAALVFTDAVLDQLTIQLPTNQAEFLNIPGIGPAKYQHFGTAALEVICHFVEQFQFLSQQPGPARIITTNRSTTAAASRPVRRSLSSMISSAAASRCNQVVPTSSTAQATTNPQAGSPTLLENQRRLLFQQRQREQQPPLETRLAPVVATASSSRRSGPESDDDDELEFELATEPVVAARAPEVIDLVNEHVAAFRPSRGRRAELASADSDSVELVVGARPFARRVTRSVVSRAADRDWMDSESEDNNHQPRRRLARLTKARPRKLRNDDHDDEVLCESFSCEEIVRRKFAQAAAAGQVICLA
jgi:HRDC domain